MIDTDKYTGHTPAPWDELLSVGVEDQEGWDALLELGFNDEARLLIADAPLFLAEIKRLRELLVKGSDDYTTSYMDLREIIEDVYWALIGDDVHYSESDGARIKYALGILSVVIG